MRYHLVIKADEGSALPPLRMDAPSVPLALLVADINMNRGTADLWQGDKRLARMRKRHCQSYPFWELA